MAYDFSPHLKNNRPITLTAKEKGDNSHYDVTCALTYAGPAVVRGAVAVVTFTSERPWKVDTAAVRAFESCVTLVDV